MKKVFFVVATMQNGTKVHMEVKGTSEDQITEAIVGKCGIESIEFYKPAWMIH